MLPPLAAGGGLVMLSTMKELPATLLAAPFDFETLATRIWTANEGGFLADAGLASLVLIAVYAVKMIQPLVVLAKTAEQLARGDLRCSIYDPRTADEVGILSRAFTQLVTYMKEMAAAVVTPTA